VSDITYISFTTIIASELLYSFESKIIHQSDQEFTKCSLINSDSYTQKNVLNESTFFYLIDDLIYLIFYLIFTFLSYVLL